MRQALLIGDFMLSNVLSFITNVLPFFDYTVVFGLLLWAFVVLGLFLIIYHYLIIGDYR